MDLLGIYFGEHGGREYRIEVLEHRCKKGCACRYAPDGRRRPRSGLEIRWSGGMRVTIERGRDDTVREYLEHYHARPLRELVDVR